MTQVVQGLYTVALAGLALYALHALALILLYLLACLERRGKGKRPTPYLLSPLPADDELPCVTVQVPLRNEQHVARRCLEAVAGLDWPRERLEIQVLDDSDDATVEVVDTTVAELRAEGVTIEVLRREQPVGYKAGALAAGMTTARGAYVAIFDADFCPAPDFLRRTVPYLLEHPELGMVQARWGHLNAEASLMTRVQALILDAHFTVEHLAREHAGLLTNFNGTAGVWRRAAIEDAGGWQSDTLTEDLDLSYRAQVRGWRVRYLPDVVVPAELPPLVTAFKAQQERWATGAFQCLRKLAQPILRSQHLTPAQKLMGLLHLSGYANQPLLLLMILLTLPMVFTNPSFADFTIWLGTLASIPALLYLLGQMHLYRDWLRRIWIYPVLMFLWIGLAWSLSLAACRGLLRWGGTFVRTPKYGITDGGWKASAYRPGVNATWVGELLIGIYVCVAIWVAVRLEHSHLIPLALGYALGEVLVLAMTAVQAFALRPGGYPRSSRST
jgi:cellulose synthase/poly-beta-1,6-N-acetylglucosamine synthase-like glycosyltransferase